MHNIKLIIEYNGTKYCGWQTQRVKKRKKRTKRQKPSIQEMVENSLKKILKQKVSLFASGRTDSGVHAIGQVANFKTTSEFSPHKLKLALNAILPKDIRISKSEYVALNFHSQYSVKSKVYRYLIQCQDIESVFLKDYLYWSKFSLDTRLIKKAAKLLLGKHDFKAFCASGSNVKTTTRTIKRISITSLRILSYKVICIEVEANGFLYNMVRNIAGTLIEIGRGRFRPEYIKEILKRKDRALAGPCIPAKGLYLFKVKY